MAARVSLVPMGVLILSVAGRSGDAPTPLPISKSDDPAEFTKAFVAQAIDRYEAEGRDAALAYHGTMESVDGRVVSFRLRRERLCNSAPDGVCERRRRHQRGRWERT